MLLGSSSEEVLELVAEEMGQTKSGIATITKTRPDTLLKKVSVRFDETVTLSV